VIKSCGYGRVFRACSVRLRKGVCEMPTSNTKNRGFASMNAEKQREIARKGGRAAHEKGTAHEFTADEARAAGRKGGERVSANREHMSRIGRLGGKSSAGRRAANPQPGNNDDNGQSHPGTSGSSEGGDALMSAGQDRGDQGGGIQPGQPAM
jgi:general stress protein YciG